MSENEYNNLTKGSKFTIVNISAIWELQEDPQLDRVVVTRDPAHPLVPKNNYKIFKSQVLRDGEVVNEQCV